VKVLESANSDSVEFLRRAGCSSHRSRLRSAYRKNRLLGAGQNETRAEQCPDAGLHGLRKHFEPLCLSACLPCRSFAFPTAGHQDYRWTGQVLASRLSRPSATASTSIVDMIVGHHTILAVNPIFTNAKAHRSILVGWPVQNSRFARSGWSHREPRSNTRRTPASRFWKTQG